MFSALKFVAAAAIVALFGSLLFAGVLTTPQDGEVLPGVETEAPAPAFPTGTFESEQGGLTLELRPDGTCDRAGVPCTFGVVGSLFAEMTFEEPSGVQAPATYYWEFDGEELTFELWGVDKRPGRQEIYAGHTYRALGQTGPLPPAETGLPTGTLVEADTNYSPRLILRGDGTYEASIIGTHLHEGVYVVNGNLYTEMTSDSGKTVEHFPATYRWDWDGERLAFSPWGVDEDGYRRAIYTDHVYVMDESSNALAGKRRFLLSHPQLDIWATVEVSRRDGGYEATATVDGEPLGEGVGDTLQEAVEAALEPLGEPYASEMADSVKG